MSGQFIRAIWGRYDRSHPLLERRYKIDIDIERIQKNPFNEPFKTFIFGQENYDLMIAKGFDCILVDADPTPYDPIKFVYRHKLELIKYAMQHHPEIVYLDWDCTPTKKLPEDFWTELNKRAPIQFCLEGYKRPKCGWRKFDQNIVPNGGWLYCRDRAIITECIELWNLNPQDNDEPSFAQYVDNQIGGWNKASKDLFWAKYESMYCILKRKSVYDATLNNNKPHCFYHRI